MKFWTTKRMAYAVLAFIAVLGRLVMGMVVAYALLFGGYRTYRIWEVEHPIADLSNEKYELSSLIIKGEVK